MKRFILILLVLPLLTEAQTIPNGGFETWYFVGWSENPESWITDNTELGPTVSKDYDAYEGEYAMRVTAQPTGVGEHGEAYTLIETSSVPAALNFYAKSEVEFGSAYVEITILNGENEIDTQYWYGTDLSSEFTPVSISLNQIEPIITHMRIKVVAEVGDLVAGSAWISVDEMEFGEPLKVESRKKAQFKIYPNPASDNISIQSPQGIVGQIFIVDAQGKKVYDEYISREFTSIDIEKFPQGMYTIVANEGTPVVGKFVVN